MTYEGHAAHGNGVQSHGKQVHINEAKVHHADCGSAVGGWQSLLPLLMPTLKWKDFGSTRYQLYLSFNVNYAPSMRLTREGIC